jgi:hypothetical protein
MYTVSIGSKLVNINTTITANIDIAIPINAKIIANLQWVIAVSRAKISLVITILTKDIRTV